MVPKKEKTKDRFMILAAYTVLFALALYLPSFFGFFKRELNIYTYSDTINIRSIEEFERLMGVKVNVKFYDTPGEFFTELKARKGKGYDVLLPTSFAVQLLINEGLLKKLDYTKIPNAAFVDPRLLHKFSDPTNSYSIPYAWGIVGIGYDKQTLPDFSRNPTWRAIFEPHKFHDPTYKVSLTDDYLELIFLASLYLRGSVLGINEHMNTLQKMFIQQKPYVESYTSGNQKYLLKGEIIPLLVAESAVMRRIMIEDDRFGFIIPKEGALYSIENLGISTSSKKVDLAHAFINFMISKKTGLMTWQNGYNPSNAQCYKEIEHRFITDKSFFPDDQTFDRLHLIHNDVSIKRIEEMWLQIKLA